MKTDDPSRTRYCCPLHIVAGGSGLGHSGTKQEMTVSDAKSFDDEHTPKATSSHLERTDNSLKDLLPKPDARRRLLIRGADVLTLRSSTLLRNHDVHIEGELITRLAPSGAQVPPGCEVIEARGKVLLPGLSDLHVHPFTANWAEVIGEGLQLPNPLRFVLPYQLHLFQYLAAGITRIQTMNGDPDMLALRDRVASGQYLGPTMRVATPIIDGPTSVMSRKVSWLVNDEKGGREAARRAQAGGYDFLKPYSRLPLGGYRGLMATAREMGLQSTGHIPIDAGAETAIAEGQHIAHAREYIYCLVPDCTYDAMRMERLARATVEAGRYVQTTLLVFIRGDQAIDGQTAQWLKHPDATYANPMMKHAFAPDGPMVRSIAEGGGTFREQFLNFGTYTTDAIRCLHAAGAMLLSGTDSPGWCLTEGFSLHEELELLVRQCGLSPYETLKSSTVNAAAYHGESGRAGIVAEGARADLLLLNSNPLDDIRATRTIDTVIVRGVSLGRSILDEGLRRIRDVFASMAF